MSDDDLVDKNARKRLEPDINVQKVSLVDNSRVSNMKRLSEKLPRDRAGRRSTDKKLSNSIFKDQYVHKSMNKKPSSSDSSDEFVAPRRDKKLSPSFSKHSKKQSNHSRASQAAGKIPEGTSKNDESRKLSQMNQYLIETEGSSNVQDSTENQNANEDQDPNQESGNVLDSNENQNPNEDQDPNQEQYPNQEEQQNYYVNETMEDDFDEDVTTEHDYKGANAGVLNISSSYEQNISALNFHVSDTELSQLTTDKTNNILKFAKGILYAKKDFMPAQEFELTANKLYKCCLKSVTDMHELHLRRVLALSVLKEIISRSDPDYIGTGHIIHMIWSVMSCLHHFQLRLKAGSNQLMMHKRQKMLDKCMDYYLRLIQMFNPKMHRIILSAIITFYKDGKLWEIDFACTDMIVSLLNIYPDVEDGINELLNAAVYATSSSEIEAQSIMQVVYEVLKNVMWRTISKKLMDRLIRMLESSISPGDEREYLYLSLRLGIELCLRHLITNISNSDVMVMVKKLLKTMVADEDESDEYMTCFGNLAIFAANRYVMKTFYYSITRDLLDNISLLTHAKNPVTFLIATRIWLKLIDRNKNSLKVNQPRIFFYDCDYGISLKKCRPLDKKFFKAHRNYFYDWTLDCFKQCTSRMQMNAIFEVCALTLLEIPCGHTAATFTSVAMSMQEYALNISSSHLVISHYLHATALSLLSLISHIHRAEVFNRYVANIIDCRAEWAPQLIPPLKPTYSYALHHILWNKPELFFEDWETRYGLWKCFRIRKKKK